MAVRLKTWLSQERNNSMNIANRRKGPFQIPAKNYQIPAIVSGKRERESAKVFYPHVTSANPANSLWH